MQVIQSSTTTVHGVYGLSLTKFISTLLHILTLLFYHLLFDKSCLNVAVVQFINILESVLLTSTFLLMLNYLTGPVILKICQNFTSKCVLSVYVYFYFIYFLFVTQGLLEDRIPPSLSPLGHNSPFPPFHTKQDETPRTKPPSDITPSKHVKHAVTFCTARCNSSLRRRYVPFLSQICTSASRVA